MATWRLLRAAERAGVPCVSIGQGSDSAAVVYKAIDAALEQDVEVLIIDTAGRLQAKFNLMQELEKVRNIIARKLPDAPHETLLVIDATTGALLPWDPGADNNVNAVVADATVAVQFIKIGENPRNIVPYRGAVLIPDKKLPFPRRPAHLFLFLLHAHTPPALVSFS